MSGARTSALGSCRSSFVVSGRANFRPCARPTVSCVILHISEMPVIVWQRITLYLILLTFGLEQAVSSSGCGVSVGCFCPSAHA